MRTGKSGMSRDRWLLKFRCDISFEQCVYNCAFDERGRESCNQLPCDFVLFTLAILPSHYYNYCNTSVYIHGNVYSCGTSQQRALSLPLIFSLFARLYSTKSSSRASLEISLRFDIIDTVYSLMHKLPLPYVPSLPIRLLLPFCPVHTFTLQYTPL